MLAKERGNCIIYSKTPYQPITTLYAYSELLSMGGPQIKSCPAQTVKLHGYIMEICDELQLPWKHQILALDGNLRADEIN